MIHWGKVDKGELEPGLVEDLEAMLEPCKYNFYVTEGFRSIERSNLLNAAYKAGRGPRAAPGGKSAHNYGLAIDVALDGDDVKDGLQPTWNTKMAGWLWLKATCAKHPRLKSGWSFNDWPHIERYKWERYK